MKKITPEQFRIERLTKRLTQWDLALATAGKVKQFEISLFENGKIKLSEEKLNLLLKAID